MSNIKAVDADENVVYLKAAGAGTDLDPFVKDLTVTEANSSAISTNIAAIANAVDGTEFQVDIITLPGTIQADIGAIKIASEATQAAAELLDNIVFGNEAHVDVVSLPSIEVSKKNIQYVTGTIATAGDNTIIDIGAATGYSAGDRIYVTSLILQNETSTATTAVVKDGATAIARALGQNQGDGLALTFSRGNEWALTPDNNLIVNLSGANSFGYSVSYYLES